MSETKKRVFRLFQVAKELNVGSSTLVDHLVSRGFEVKNSPNAKLTEELYGILMKEFASEKLLKEKAELQREQKREGKAKKEEAASEEEEILSADDIKRGALDIRPETKKEAPKTEPAVKANVSVKEPDTPPKVVEEKKAEKSAEKTKEKAEEKAGLKVIDKIDLSQFDSKGKPAKKKEEAVKAEKEVPIKEAKPETVVEKTPEKAPVPATSEKPKVEVPKETTEKQAEAPKVEKVGSPTPEAKTAPIKAKIGSEKGPKPNAEKQALKEDKPKEEEEVEEKDQKIMASDRTPRLSGLKVMGKIELPVDKKSRKDKNKAKGGTDKAEDEDAKKKRRRKRKRKKPSTTTAVPASNQKKGAGGSKRGGPRDKKKEEPSDQEIKEIIKSTLADINRRAGRERQRIRKENRKRGATKREAKEQQRLEDAKVIEVTEFITANEFANLLDIPVTAIITKCMEIGLFVSINQRLEADVISLLAEEYGHEVRFVDITETEFDLEEEDEGEGTDPRAPIVTVMGHVDHGKTSLLDYVRKANVIAGEAGGITQHIGAYEVTLENGKEITFLDTPGHEAFTAMRARGAKVTDLVIVVVAADDNVMPQTKEAINHAEAAGVPLIFAINKIDKSNADPENIKRQLAEMNYIMEDWGGKYQSQEISAKKGTAIDELLEKVLLEAEMLELKGSPDRRAKGTVIEAKLDKGRGVVSTVLVQDGTLRVGDCLVAGVHFGKVKALLDERGNRVKEAGPSTPVQILGLTGTPTAGDRLVVYESEKKAKNVANKRQELFREQSLRQTKHITLDEIARRKAIGDFRELNLIVKGDVDGSVEALSDSLLKLSTEEVVVNIIMKAVGQISESDVLLASASDAIIVGFQVRPSLGARKLAENEAIDIRLYSIIYDAINEVRDALEGLLSPEIREEILGSAEIRQIFKVSKVGTVAGCMVVDKKVYRNEPIRLIRDGIVIYDGHLSSLKRFKDDAKEVAMGYDCGLTIDKYNDIKVGDIVESYREVEEKRKLKK